MSDRDDQERPSVSDEPDLSRRLENLDRRLREQRGDEQPEETGPAKPGAAMAMRLASDFIAGVLLGAALGWGFDKLFGTSPWGLIVFVLLGFAAGLLSVLRSAGLMKAGPAGPDDLGDRI